MDDSTEKLLKEIRKKGELRCAARRKRERNRIAALTIIVVTAVATAFVCSKPKREEIDTDINSAHSKVSSEVDTESRSQKDNKTDIEDRGTKLYIVDNNTAFVSPDGDSGYIGGIYTGRISADDGDLIEIDYKDDYVLINAEDALPVESAEILPVGVISQLDEYTNGWSACGVACLHMMQRNLENEPQNISLKNYITLMNYAERNGYSDQGSLFAIDGGISATQMQRLAADVYGVTLENAYSVLERPSDILKAIIDSGKQAIVLCKYKDGSIVTYGSRGHFILVSGYVESEGKTTFLYADSYYSDEPSHGNSLMHVGEDLLDRSVSAEFDEPNAILFFSEKMKD